MFTPAPAIWIRIHLALAVVFAVAGFLAANVGRGDMQSNIALAPAWLALVYGGFLSVALLFAVLALCEQRTRAALPYRPGTYLFPIGVVDARQPEFRVHGMDQLTAVTTGGKRLKLQFQDGGRFEFVARDAESAERGRGMVQGLVGQVQQTLASGDKHALALLDPLLDTGFFNPLGPDAPLKRILPGWRRPALVAALVAGLPLGLLVWHARNRSSASALLEQAKAENSLGAYQTYLERGGKDPQVKDLLLPRAKLARARKIGSVEAIEKFIASEPSPLVQGEAELALRKALLDELAQAKKSGRLADLKRLSGHPRRNLLEPELSQAIHAAYERAYASFQKKAPGASQRTLEFVQELLGYVEKHGPRVELRFVEQPSASHMLADIAVKRSAYYGGTASVPSQYFREGPTKKREARFAKGVVTALQSAFPPDVLKVEVGAREVGESDQLPSIEVPTLFVVHRAELSGTYVNPNPAGVFVGVGLLFRAVFRIPGSDRELMVKTSSWNRPDSKLLAHDAAPGDVYDAAASAGFAEFDAKLLRMLGLQK